MSTLRVDTITDEAGTGAPNFPNGATGLGALFSETVSVSSNTTITSADAGKVFACTAALTLTLPAPTEGLVIGVVASVAGDLAIAAASGSTKVGAYTGSALISANSSAILVADGTNWSILGGTGGITIKVQQFSSSGTYTPNGPVAFLACCTGSTSGSPGASYQTHPPSGGAGYSEKFFSAPLDSSYAVVIGAAGVGASETAGGTTTFDTISVSCGPAPLNNTTGPYAGGVGSGGDFNATGGSGGQTLATATGASGGGSATRAGDGGDAGHSDTNAVGGAGGTGGNDGTDGVGAPGTPGIAATADAAGAYDITLLSNPVYQAGGAYSGATHLGSAGASSLTRYTDPVSGSAFTIGSTSAGGGSRSYGYAYAASFNGSAGHITIVEFYA